MKVLEVKNLIKNYKDVHAVKDISFDISENEIFALVGPNGAGKSTTLKVVATILSPTSGEVLILGNDVVKNSNKVRKIISYLPEEAGAYKNLSGNDYLKFMAGLYAENKEQEREFLNFAVKISGLKERLKTKIKTYSKGMTRKLLLARTVMSRPKLAILDEPTSGLDVLNAFEIRNIIKSLSKEGMAVLLSSHNMLEIEFLSQRVALIDKGEIKAAGTPEDLKNKYQSANLEEVFVKIAV
jgi:ABC-2 type transport system ATP-binding protein